MSPSIGDEAATIDGNRNCPYLVAVYTFPGVGGMQSIRQILMVGIAIGFVMGAIGLVSMSAFVH